jgi:transcriptional regulator with XRE-family HTH domain
MEVSKLLAININTLRLKRNLSLGKLATLSGVSKVMLSQIEKGGSNPSINVICKIAKGLNVPYTALLEDNRGISEIVREEDALFQSDADGQFRVYTYYNASEKRNFEFFRFELDPGTRYTSSGHGTKLIEYIMVIEGELTLMVNDRTYVLKANESIDLDTTDEHTYYASGDSLVKAISIGHYPI